MWGIWWIFPLIGLLFIIVVLLGISRFFGGGAGFWCGRRYDEIDDLRRKISELKDEIAKLGKKEKERKNGKRQKGMYGAWHGYGNGYDEEDDGRDGRYAAHYGELNADGATDGRCHHRDRNIGLFCYS
jgi:hypothetical protein